jgi:predicted nucleotidyltransferase
MKIEKNSEIGGVPVVSARAFFRASRDYDITVESIMRRLELPRERAVAFFDAIKSDGFIEMDPEGRRNGRYQLSLKGSALAIASFTKRFNRATAQRYVDQLMVRLGDINASAELTHRVREVRVFGSYIEDTDDLGDVDIAVDLEPRGASKSIVEQSRERARASGRTLSFIQELVFGQREVMKLVRGGCSRLSVHPFSQLELLECKSEVLFPRPNGQPN